MATDKIGYSIAEACSRIGLGRSTLYELMTAGELAVVKVGRRTIIPASELDSFIERRTVRQGAGSGPEAA